MGEDSTYVDRWKQEQLDDCRRVVNNLLEMVDKLKRLPASHEDARKLVAADNVGQLISVVREMESTELSKLQMMSAALRGRGLKHAEIASLLDVPGGPATLHIWENTSSAYRKATKYWRQVTEEDQLAMALREIEEVASKTTDSNLMLKLIRLRLLLADKPEDRARWQKEIELREREVAAKEREVDKESGAEPPFDVPRIIEPEFEVLDAESE